MPTTIVKKQKRQLRVRLDTTGRRWCERNGVPNGYALALRSASDRRVRGDTIIHRRKLPAAASDSDRLSEAFDTLKAVMITDIDARRQRFCLVTPNGDNVPQHTTMRTIRSYEGLPASDDIEAAEFVELSAEIITEGMRDHFSDEEEIHGREAVLLGCIRALLERFTRQEILAVITAE